MRQDCPRCICGLYDTGSSRIPCPYCGGKGYTESDNSRKPMGITSAFLLFIALMFLLMFIAAKLGIGDKKETKSIYPPKETTNNENVIDSQNETNSTQQPNSDSSGEPVTVNEPPESTQDGGGRVYINSVTNRNGIYYCDYTVKNEGNKPESYDVSIGIQENRNGEGFLYYSDHDNGGDFINLGLCEPGYTKSFTQAFPSFSKISNYRYRIRIVVGDHNSEASMECYFCVKTLEI